MKLAESASVDLQERPPARAPTFHRRAAAAPPIWALAGEPRGRRVVQAKLSVSRPGDALEVEADGVAEQVMRSSGRDVCRCGAIGGTCSCGSSTVRRSALKPTPVATAPASVDATVAGSGRPLNVTTRSFMEPRFGRDLRHVRVHTDRAAARSAADIGALAYTVGRDIVFADGQYAPATIAGRRLLAHELVHTVQQERGVIGRVVQRYGGCTTAQDSSVTDDHLRALRMTGTAIAQLARYNGTSPGKVHTALSTHFGGATSASFGAWIAANLTYLFGAAALPAYECYTGGILESAWACGGRALATTFWCVPGVDIRLCPSYFGQTPTERSATLIHEWVHKYGCNLDLGYEHESGYSGNSSLTQLLNADSFANFVRDVQ